MQYITVVIVNIQGYKVVEYFSYFMVFKNVCHNVSTHAYM